MAIRLVTALACVMAAAGCALDPFRDVPYPTISPRPGLKPASMSYFGWGVPDDWQEETSNSTLYFHDHSGALVSTGDVFSITTCPATSGAPPLTPYNANRGRVAGGGPLAVPGARAGWRFELTGGPNGDSTLLTAWLPNCEQQLWLNIRAPKTVADQIASSVIAQQQKK